MSTDREFFLFAGKNKKLAIKKSRIGSISYVPEDSVVYVRTVNSTVHKLEMGDDYTGEDFWYFAKSINDEVYLDEEFPDSFA